MPGGSRRKDQIAAEELEQRLGRPLSDHDRDLLEVLNTALGQDAASPNEPAEPSSDGGVTQAPSAAVCNVARRLLDSLRGATEDRRTADRERRLDAAQLRIVLARLTPLLEAIAHSANELVDATLGEARVGQRKRSGPGGQE